MNERKSFEDCLIPNQVERELTSKELREKLRDPSYLPTYEDILCAFKKKGPFSHEWSNFLFNEENPVFELLNKEFIDAFGDYLIQRVENFSVTENEPLTILEVGAGNGRLTYFLQQKFEQKIPGKVKIVATDSGAWELKAFFPVEQLNHKEALEKYQPKIVIFSWMPNEEDYTKDFRVTKSVDEYILIGEADGGCCGHRFETWGLDQTFGNKQKKRYKSPLAPYEVDGFERINVDETTALQISRSDNDLFKKGYHHSETVSFRRKKFDVK